MSKHQVRSALRQEIEGGHTGGFDSVDATGGHGTNESVTITPTSDTCINRENPQRKVGGRTKLVVGYDSIGQFENAIPDGNTHGYWTLAKKRKLGTNPSHVSHQWAKPTDGAGTGGDYVARTLLHFTIGHTKGPTAGDVVQSAELKLWVDKFVHKDLLNEYEYDIHRVHSPAEHALHGQTFGFTSNATWYEHDWSDGITHGGTFNLGGLTGIAPPGTSGPRWHFEGLGVTGFTAGAAIFSGDITGVTSQWSDFSGSTGNVGYGGHYQTVAGGISAGITAFPALEVNTIDYNGNGGFYLKVDSIKPHVQDAIDNFNGHLQLLVKLKDDHTHDGKNNIQEYLVLNSKEAIARKPELIINYRQM